MGGRAKRLNPTPLFVVHPESALRAAARSLPGRAGGVGNGKHFTAPDTVTVADPSEKGWPAMAVAVLVVVVLVLVIGLGWFIIFRLMKRTQTVVPSVTDEHAARTDRVVAVDDRGQPVSEAEDGAPEPPRDAAGFEKVLGESLDDLHPGREE